MWLLRLLRLRLRLRLRPVCWQTLLVLLQLAQLCCIVCRISGENVVTSCTVVVVPYPVKLQQTRRE